MQMCRGTHLIGFIVCTSVCTSSLTMKYATMFIFHMTLLCLAL